MVRGVANEPNSSSMAREGMEMAKRRRVVCRMNLLGLVNGWERVGEGVEVVGGVVERATGLVDGWWMVATTTTILS